MLNLSIGMKLNSKIACRFAFLISAIFFSNSAISKTINIGQEFEFKTINSGIVSADKGDTLLVHNGTYKEGGIIIQKELVLIGNKNPILDGENKYEILTIAANNVVIEGFTIINSGAGVLNDPAAIKIIGCKGVIIRNNILINNVFAIYIQNGKHCSITNNSISSQGTLEQSIGNGIHCWKSDSLLIIANNIKGHRDGIYFEFVTGSVIWRNISTNNVRYGLHFMFSNNDSYIGNLFRDNGAGVAVMFTKKVTMINNFFEDNWGDASFGLLLKEISDSYISGNKFSGNTCGIHMEGASRITMENNEIKSNGWGIKVQASCIDNNIISNNFIGNTFDISTNGSLVLNNFDGNYWDKYEGYDLNRDGAGDVPFHPLSLFSVIAENNPSAMLLYRSFFVGLLDKSERLLPTLTPDNFTDHYPRMSTSML